MPRQVTEAALARMVMPRSRSWSLESMTRSTSAWCARETRRSARSMASTSVVLPWSTWATSATLRMAGGGISIIAPERRAAWRSGLVVLVVEVVVVVELDAIFGSELRVLVVLSGRGTRRIGVRSTEGAERLRAGLLELAGFFEAPMATLLHGRAPRADATMGNPV